MQVHLQTEFCSAFYRTILDFGYVITRGHSRAQFLLVPAVDGDDELPTN